MNAVCVTPTPETASTVTPRSADSWVAEVVERMTAAWSAIDGSDVMILTVTTTLAGRTEVIET